MNLKVICGNYEQNSVTYDQNTGNCQINAIFRVIDADGWDRWDGQCLVTFAIDDPVPTINAATKARIIQYVLDTFSETIGNNDIKLMWA